MSARKDMAVMAGGSNTQNSGNNSGQTNNTPLPPTDNSSPTTAPVNSKSRALGIIGLIVGIVFVALNVWLIVAAIRFFTKRAKG